MTERLYNFVGGRRGPWKVVKLSAVTGPGLEPVERLDVVPAELKKSPRGQPVGFAGRHQQ